MAPVIALAIGSAAMAGTPSPLPRQTSLATLETARDSVEAISRRALARDTSVHWNRSPAQFTYWYSQASVRGWAIHMTVTDSTGCPTDTLERSLEAAGWTPNYDYSADGPDGHVQGYVQSGYLCVLDARWDGEDDSDPTYVPAPGCQVILTCVPFRKDDAATR